MAISLFKAGKYYVGDPCYAIQDWEAFCAVMDEPDMGAFQFKGHECFAYGTAYGDGKYEGSDGEHYTVDSGTIALIPVALVERKMKAHERASIHTFDRPFVATYINGTFCFDSLEIPTDLHLKSMMESLAKKQTN